MFGLSTAPLIGGEEGICIHCIALGHDKHDDTTI
jgi:hypothetical protein